MYLSLIKYKVTLYWIVYASVPQLFGVLKIFQSIIMAMIQPSCCLMIAYLVFLFPGPSSDALYRELWHACAGPLVTLPRQDERVYYFPQGHMEQVSDLVMHTHCSVFRLYSRKH